MADSLDPPAASFRTDEDIVCVCVHKASTADEGFVDNHVVYAYSSPLSACPVLTHSLDGPCPHPVSHFSDHPQLQAQGFAIRNGHMYARRLVGALLPSISHATLPDGPDAVEEGVVRISLLVSRCMIQTATIDVP